MGEEGGIVRGYPSLLSSYVLNYVEIKNLPHYKSYSVLHFPKAHFLSLPCLLSLIFLKLKYPCTFDHKKQFSAALQILSAWTFTVGCTQWCTLLGHESEAAA